MDSPLHKVFCERLRQLRKAARISQIDMAAAVGLSQAAYSCLETGKSCANVVAIESLAKVLRVSPAAFFERPAAGKPSKLAKRRLVAAG